MRKFFMIAVVFCGCVSGSPDGTQDPPADAMAYPMPPDARPLPDATADAAAAVDAGPDAGMCGELDQPCCQGDFVCNGGAHSDIYCSTGGICRAPVPDCGGEGQACCNPLCFPSGSCITWPCKNNQDCQAGTCVLFPSPDGCGAENEPCCKHPNTNITFCDIGFSCDGESSDGVRTCIN